MNVQKDTYLPRVTIAIPTYNNAGFLEEAVNSALQQDYPNLRIVILDDASTDGTREKMKAFANDTRVSCFSNETNLGRVATYRRCLYELAEGDWYLNLDGDDYLTDPGYISKAVRWTREFPDVVMVTGAVERRVDGVFDYLIHSRYEGELNCVPGKEYFLGLPSKRSYFSHLGTLYHRRKAMELDFYKEDIISADYESLYRLVLLGNIVSYDKVVGVWRIHGANETIRKIGSVEQIMKNFRFVEKPALFARDFLSEKEVDGWRRENLVVILESYIAKLIIERPGNGFKLIFALIGKYPLRFVQAAFRILARRLKKVFGKK